MYAAGKSSPQKHPSEQLLRNAVKGSQSYCTDSEVLQEILHRYVSIGKREIGFRLVEYLLALGIVILPVNAEDVLRAKILMEQFPKLSTRDAIHIGVMQGHSIKKIATFDRAFLEVPWIELTSPKPYSPAALSTHG